MPRIDVVVSTPISRSPRCRQLEGMFDVPHAVEQTQRWTADMPIEDRDWNVGLIVGPSGCGKSTIAREVFREAVDRPLTWAAASVIDDFRSDSSIADVAAMCQAVGFNTIPAWLRPFDVLSNGEKFRVEMARRLLEGGDLVVVDEFTSVVDRQVAQIGAHAVQKHVRKLGTQFVAVTCHYDVIDWLQPDWVFEPATRSFAWRSLRRRPELECEIRRVPWSLWETFAPFHYMTADLHRAARCFALFVREQPAAFCGVIPMPHAQKSAHNIRRVSRAVTLPDYQGLGLIFAMLDRVASLHAALGFRLRCYPAHPSFVRSFRSPTWALVKRPGVESGSTGRTSSVKSANKSRPCAVFEYRGESHPDERLARAMIL